MPRQGQETGTPARRAEFIDRLRAIGPGRFCINWPWSSIRDDYVYIHVNGEKVRAHRWVYEQFHGPLERTHQRGAVGEELVLHTCDNRACVRPNHLFLGSQLDNIGDAIIKGRMRGAPPVLSPSDIERVRALHESGTTIRDIAGAFGVSYGTIANVIHYRSAYRKR